MSSCGGWNGGRGTLIETEVSHEERPATERARSTMIRFPAQLLLAARNGAYTKEVRMAEVDART